MSAEMGVTAGIMAGIAKRPSTLSRARQVMPKALRGTMGSMIQKRDWVRASFCASKLEARRRKIIGADMPVRTAAEKRTAAEAPRTV
jgi:hypothetical protein